MRVSEYIIQQEKSTELERFIIKCLQHYVKGDMK